MKLPPPRSTLFPYTTLFRSLKSIYPSDSILSRLKRSCDSTPAQHGSIPGGLPRSEEHTSELQSRGHLVCRLLLEKKKESDAPPSKECRLTADEQGWIVGREL